MISYFDVNENNGNIALCFEDSGRKKIGIYDSDGKFKYGYSFLESGSIGVEWDGNNIIIYSVRGDRAILIDKDAHLIDMKRIIINSQNNTYLDFSQKQRERITLLVSKIEDQSAEWDDDEKLEKG